MCARGLIGLFPTCSPAGNGSHVARKVEVLRQFALGAVGRVNMIISPVPSLIGERVGSLGAVSLETMDGELLSRASGQRASENPSCGD